MKHLVAVLVVLILGLATGWLSPPQQARAQSETAYDLINTVNALRASLGLVAYTVDPWLMAYAQQHADYIDSLNSGTHTHSDGTLPWDSGIQENVGGGTTGIMTAAIVVYQIWVDEGHRKPMVGYSSGEVGAGIAVSEDDGQTYYVLNVRPAVEEDASAQADAVTPAPAATAAFVPLLTSTPRADGWIIHTVAEGQTLWSIAISYGTTVNAIRELNGIPVDSTTIYVGQELKIVQGSAPASTQAGAVSAAYLGTPGVPGSSPTATAQPSSTATTLPSPSPTSTPSNLLQRLPANRVTGAYVLLAIGLVGLFLVVRFCFFGARRRG